MLYLCKWSPRFLPKQEDDKSKSYSAFLDIVETFIMSRKTNQLLQITELSRSIGEWIMDVGVFLLLSSPHSTPAPTSFGLTLFPMKIVLCGCLDCYVAT